MQSESGLTTVRGAQPIATSKIRKRGFMLLEYKHAGVESTPVDARRPGRSRRRRAGGADPGEGGADGPGGRAVVRPAVFRDGPFGPRLVHRPLRARGEGNAGARRSA